MAKLKLSREQIERGLEQIPMENILKGASGSEINLTKRQLDFAREIALGAPTKAGAYRKVYNTKGKPKTVANKAYKLANRDDIQAAVDVFKAQDSLNAYQNPAQIRALVVSQLTKHALDEDFPHAQRVQCLKLLGSVAEVGLFVDRKETLVVHKSDDIRQRLLDQLKTVINTQAEDITPNNDDADSLLAELNEPPPENQEVPDADPTGVPPPALVDDHPVDSIHSIPHTQSPENSDEHHTPIYPDK